MIGLLVAGHGQFAEGLISSVNLIMGEQKYLQGVEFKLNDSTEELESNINKELENMKKCDGILFLTDIVGGTPFKTCVLISQNIKNSKVLSGVNLPILLEAVITRDTKDINNFKENLIEIGKQGIKSFELDKKS